MDPNKKSKDINLSGLAQRPIEQSYEYWDHDPQVDTPLAICPLTMRPFARVDHAPWQTHYQKVF